MANAVAEKSQDTSLSAVLTNNLTSVQAGLPKNFNIQRFVNNSIALLNGNENLISFMQSHKSTAMSQVKAGLMKGAYLGLDFMSSECYLIPYGSTLQFQTSYRGMTKIAKKYSIEPIREIFANVVREDDFFEMEEENGNLSYVFKPVAFSNKPIVGAFAVCVFESGTTFVETMSKDDLEKTRNQSKAKSSGAWTSFTSEMYKKVVIKRLCKRIPIEFETAEQATAYNEDEAIETDIREVVKQEITENANAVDFADVIEGEVEEVTE